METKAIVTYVICDDTIKDLGIVDDVQSIMSTAEVMTTAIISAIQYSGNIEKTRQALKSERYIPNMLSKTPSSTPETQLISLPLRLSHA